MKDDKLIRFFNAIDFNKEYLKYYENASLKEVLLRRKENRMTMVINIDSLPPIEAFKETYEKGKTLEGADEVRFKFIVENNTLLFKEYFDYYFDILVSKCPMLNCIDRNKITFENNKINIEVLNPAEYNKIEEIKEKIEIFMSDMGFDDVEVNPNINEEEREKFKKELNTTTEKIVNKEVRKTIKGNPIAGEASEIKNLITNEDRVVLIAKVFGIDSKSTQSGWFIITLKLTDYTDSIMANILDRKSVV